jgi:hypothetical protein
MKTLEDLTEEEFVELASESVNALSNYLIDNEDNIALGLEGFGALKSVFLFTTGREAVPTVFH